MKHSLLAAALLAVGVTAQAQSSVELYGRLDAGIEYINRVPSDTSSGTSSRIRAESGNWGANLWGIRGDEELGGGLRAIFDLEGAFNLQNGQAPSGYIFSRRAWVGLQSDRYGTLTFGRNLSLVSDGTWAFDPLGQTVWSMASLVYGRNWPIYSNNIMYQSPVIAGFDVYTQYSLSNSTHFNGGTGANQGRNTSVQLTYTGNHFQVRGIYDEARDPANGQFDDVFQYSREYFLGGSVDIGPTTVRAAYQSSHADSAAYTYDGNSTTTQLFWGGVTWQATAAAAVTGAVYHVNANKGGGSASIFALGGTYNLSKRTLLDLEIADLRNSSHANFSLDGDSAFVVNTGDVVSSDGPGSGHSQFGVFVGIQHAF